MLAALRYRRAQAAVVAMLSALVTTCLVLAPLYVRALEQATVRSLLHAATPQQAGLRLASTSPSEPAIALSPENLADLLPARVRGFYGAPVASTAVDVRRMPLGSEPGGRLLARAGACDNVRLTAGRCPVTAGEVVVSGDQARRYATRVGSTVVVGEFDGAVSAPEATPRTTLTVVGTYEQVGGAYWFGDRLTGPSARGTGFDVMLTPLESITDQVTAPDGTRMSWLQPQYAVDLPLVTGRVGIDEIGALGSTVAQLVRTPLGPARVGSHVADTVSVRTGLPALADEVQVGSDQARVTVPLLMAQMGLLLGCVLWLVLLAAADQRRREVAVVRIRGRGSRGARRLLLGETVPFVVLGVPLGALLAVGATTVARHTLLTFQPPFEVPLAAVVALLAGLALMVGLAVLSVRRVCRAPVADLLRSVPRRRTDVRLGVLEAMLVAAAGAAFVAVVTGSVDGPVGEVAPTLLALAVGVVAARLIPWGLAAGGRQLVRRGRATAGAAFLMASRRGATRWLVPVVTVALSIVVVTANALAVGSRNWEGRAAAEVGASTVLTLDSANLVAVTTAVAGVDPTAVHVTPVALVGPTEPGGSATVGVVPSSFRRIALWPGVPVAALPWDRLSAPTTPPLTLTGSRVTYRVDSPGFDVVNPVIRPAPKAMALVVRVVHPDGTVESLPLGTLPAGGVVGDQAAVVSCENGCRVAGFGVRPPASSAAVTGTVSISGLRVDDHPVDLGGQQAWRDTSTGEVDATGTVTGDAMRIGFATDGFDEAVLAHASVPGIVPALTTAPATPSAPGATFGGSFVDGTGLALASVGRVGLVPGGPAAASIVNLDNLLAQGWTGRGSATLAAYLDTSDPAYVQRVTAGLAERGIRVASTRHVADVAGGYGRTAAAWSLRLALAVGVLSMLVAGVGIVVLATTSWRARSRDYAALRLSGRSARSTALVAQLETAPVILASALLGALVGLWAAPVALGMVPLFTSPPPTFALDLRSALGPAVVAGLVALGFLVLVGIVSSLRTAWAADLQRLQDPA